MTTETTVTYSADETTKAAEYVSAIVFEARTKAQEALAAKHAEERALEQAKATKCAEMLAQARAALPAEVAPFVTVENVYWSKYRAIISLPDCAPFGVDLNDSGVSSFFYSAYASTDEDNEISPALWMRNDGIHSTLEQEIARAYEAQREYDKARDALEHAQAEREHANAMSERESALRHEEEPEPSDEILPICNQPATLSDKTCEEIMQMAEKCIARADTETEGIERYLLLRAQALCAYVSARAIHA